MSASKFISDCQLAVHCHLRPPTPSVVFGSSLLNLGNIGLCVTELTDFVADSVLVVRKFVFFNEFLHFMKQMEAT